MKIFDTHCHLNLEPLTKEWQSHVKRASEKGVERIFVPGTNIQNSLRAIELSHKDHNLLPGAAIHPSEISSLFEADQTPNNDIVSIMEEDLKSLYAQHHSSISAVGETGLDYFWLKDTPYKKAAIKLQKQLFTQHIKLANEYALPISIHIRDSEEYSSKSQNAYQDVLSLLEQHHEGKGSIILHCASGESPYIKRALKLGAYFGIGGQVTYKNNAQLLKLIELVPENKLLAETDAPYLPPTPFRGKICEPWMIVHTVEYLSKNELISPDQLWANAKKAFNCYS